MDVLGGFGWPLVCQSAGELFARAPELRLPGPVLGMLLLLLLLLVLVLVLVLVLFGIPSVREPVTNAASGVVHFEILPLMRVARVQCGASLAARVHSAWRAQKSAGVRIGYRSASASRSLSPDTRQSAPAARMREQSAPSAEKSAARMDGAICSMAKNLLSAQRSARMHAPPGRRRGAGPPEQTGMTRRAGRRSHGAGQ